MRFVCRGCGTPLILPDAKSAVSGPCPKCAAWIDASELIVLEAVRKRPDANVAAAGASRRSRNNNATGGRRRVSADGYLDHEYNERRELFGTLRVLAVTLAVLAAILFVTLYLKHWMAS
jgi:hypothetical protein